MQLENWNSLGSIEKLKAWCRGQSKYSIQYIDPKRLAIDLGLTIDSCCKLLESIVKEGYANKYIKVECPNYECNNTIDIEESLIDEKNECKECGEVFVPHKYIKPSKVTEILFSIDSQYYNNQECLELGDVLNTNKSIYEEDKVIKLRNEKTDRLLRRSDETMKKKKIFLSHCSRNNNITYKFFEMLKAVGVKTDQIYYSSNETTGASYFGNCLDQIKKEFESNELLVIFMISREFYDSKVCVAEMGATWVTTENYVPIILPPLGYDYLQGVVDPMKKGILLKEETLSTKLDTLKEDIEKFLELDNNIELPDWTVEKEKFIKGVKSFEASIKDIDQDIQSIKMIDDKIVLKIEMQNNTNNRYEFEEVD